MIIKKITLINYRCYCNFKAEFTKGINIICGKNAIGKTSILEAIHHVVTTRSNRTLYDREVVSYETTESAVFAEFLSEKGAFLTKLLISNNYKKIILNGKEITKSSDYIGIVPIVSFNFNDIRLVLNNPQSRRNLMDFMLSQIDKTYLILLRDYKKTLKEKNSFLKKSFSCNDCDLALLDVLDERLYKMSFEISQARLKFVNSINSLLSKMNKKIVNKEENYFIKVKENFIVNTSLEDFKNKRNEEIYLKNAYYGPHKDDYEFFVNNKNLIKYASQSQIKTFVVALKIAYANLIQHQNHVNPIVLLDDLFGELDSERQNNIVELLGNDLQIFITTPTISDINDKIIEKSNIILLEKEE